MPEFTIKHGAFTYHNPETIVVGGKREKVLVERIAFHNETVDITDPDDIERGNALGAFWTPEQARAHYAEQELPAPSVVGGAQTAAVEAGSEEGDEEEVEVDLEDLSASDLVDWMMGAGQFDGQKKPSAVEVVDAAEGNPELADRLLTAENTASGDAPRKSVVEGLEKAKGEE